MINETICYTTFEINLNFINCFIIKLQPLLNIYYHIVFKNLNGIIGHDQWIR